MNEDEFGDRERIVWLINDITINSAIYLNISLYMNNSDWSIHYYFQYIDYLQPYIINTEIFNCDEFRNTIFHFCKNYKITIDDIAETRKQFFLFYELLKN